MTHRFRGLGSACKLTVGCRVIRSIVGPELPFALAYWQVRADKSAQRGRENWGQAKASNQCAALIWERSQRATVVSCFAAGLSGAAASQ